jgi:arylformamidase
MIGHPIAGLDYDREYNPRLSVADASEQVSRWKERSAVARAAGPVEADLHFGDRESQTIDFYPVKGARDAPLLVFLHGGYWRALDKVDFAFVAPPFVARGIAVAVVNYSLLPAVTLASIVAEVRRATRWLARSATDLGFDAQRMVCSGHSAGGHLTAMLLTHESAGPLADTPPQYAAAIAVSGLYDVEPLRHTAFLSADLRLDATEARELSPLFRPRANAVPLLLAVGEYESAEFHRQASALAQAWPESATGGVFDVPGTDHFSVCTALADPQSELFQRSCALIAATAGAR